MRKWDVERARVCACVCLCVCLYEGVYMFVCVDVRMCVCVCTRAYAHEYMCVSVSMCVRVCVVFLCVSEYVLSKFSKERKRN